MGGGGGKPSPGPTPAEQAQAQVRAQAAETRRIQAERNVRADQFLADNAVNQTFRDQILSQSNDAAQRQIDVLGSQSGGTLQDIRQRNAGRGLSQSSSGAGLTNEAKALTQSSSDDIFSSAGLRATDRINSQQRFLDSTASDIRGGRDINSAQVSFKNDITSANAAFEKALSGAATGDQRNAAFKGFESDRRLAAGRFNESVKQFQQQGSQAAIATGGGSKDDDGPVGQVGGAFGGGLA